MIRPESINADSRRLPGRWRLARRAILAVLVSIAALAGGCAPGEQAAQTISPNVVLVVIDTLRADRLGCYGYDRLTSPNIDAFAAEGTLYTRAIAAAPWTVPTHASLFTGKYPFEHGAHTVKVSRPVNNINALDEAHVTLAEFLADEGYRTGAFVANGAFLARRWQLNQGFETYHVEQAYADVLNRSVFDWLPKSDGEPFFLFVNYIDVHWPYNTARRAGFLEKVAGRTLNPVEIDAVRSGVLGEVRPLPKKQLQQLSDMYDLSIANIDEQIGALFDRLRKLDLYDNTLIVVTSDHGEQFGEHRLFGHSKDVFQTSIWVPLIVKRPGARGSAAADTLFSSVDTPRMIASCLPTAAQKRAAQLFPYKPGAHVIISENYYTRVKNLFSRPWSGRFNRVRTAVFDWPYKLIRSSRGRIELYRLDSDPDESNDLADAHNDIADRLLGQLDRFEASRDRWAGPAEPVPLSPQQRERLKSLGYIGGK